MAAHHLEAKDGFGILHLRASNANAMNDRVLEALTAGLAEARGANLRGLILTGYDRFFCAGEATALGLINEIAPRAKLLKKCEMSC
jgi:enoyl-CoA hydratase/carnithine racemase